ncbi:hypothetical protein [Paenibacillus terrigena]|uniref:hypothetical protein n=1 Tax=Paenibacillus terrigena TaxID=369333 RepID=UPI0003A30632|nr:hypothetical protein [Paenibacillus terrigena]
MLENHLPLTPAFVLSDRDERGLLIDVEIPERLTAGVFFISPDRLFYTFVEPMVK